MQAQVNPKLEVQINEEATNYLTRILQEEVSPKGEQGSEFKCGRSHFHFFV